LFKSVTGIDATIIPYKGTAQVMNDLLGSPSRPEQRRAFFRLRPPQKPASLLTLLRFATMC
jgi:hypothetical protein